MTTSTTRFEVGRILATPGALAVMRAAGESALGFLKRSSTTILLPEEY